MNRSSKKQSKRNLAVFTAIATISLGSLAGCELLVDFDRTLIDGGSLGQVDGSGFDAPAGDGSTSEASTSDASDASSISDGDAASESDGDADIDADM